MWQNLSCRLLNVQILLASVIPHTEEVTEDHDRFRGPESTTEQAFI